jgi:magnesium-transporting ATPase (P-type)
MKSVMEQEQTQKKHIINTRFWIVWIIGVAIVVAVFLFYGWKIWAFAQENSRFQVSIENTQKRLQAIAPGSEELVKKRNEVTQRAKKFRTNWSEIMKQITDLETSAVRFSKINVAKEKITASCQATSWKSLADFIAGLEKNPRVKNVRISSTTVLSPPVAGAKQSAELSFNFFPASNENK